MSSNHRCLKTAIIYVTFKKGKNSLANKFEEKIGFLCNKCLSPEWFMVGCIATPDNRIFIGSLKTAKKMGYRIELDYLLELARCLKSLSAKRIIYYIHKVNIINFNKISVVLEIIVTSKYIMNGYEIDFEPGNKSIWKSGPEGKSDLGN